MLLSQEMDFEIIEINTDLDHVHLLISCKPQHYIPTIVKRLKGASARLLFKLYPELKKNYMMSICRVLLILLLLLATH